MTGISTTASHPEQTKFCSWTPKKAWTVVVWKAELTLTVTKKTKKMKQSGRSWTRLILPTSKEASTKKTKRTQKTVLFLIVYTERTSLMVVSRRENLPSKNLLKIAWVGSSSLNVVLWMVVRLTIAKEAAHRKSSILLKVLKMVLARLPSLSYSPKLKIALIKSKADAKIRQKTWVKWRMMKVWSINLETLTRWVRV